MNNIKICIVSYIIINNINKTKLKLIHTNNIFETYLLTTNYQKLYIDFIQISNFTKYTKYTKHTNIDCFIIFHNIDNDISLFIDKCDDIRYDILNIESKKIQYKKIEKNGKKYYYFSNNIKLYETIVSFVLNELNTKEYTPVYKFIINSKIKDTILLRYIGKL